MSCPKLEVAGISRAHGPAYRRDHAGHLNLTQLKVMSAIETCRTAALGGHVAACTKCGHQHVAYNSCRNRHRPPAPEAIVPMDQRPIMHKLSIWTTQVGLLNTSSMCHRQFEYDRICCTRFRRISAANIGPNLFHQYRTVSWLMSMPRSCSRSSTLRSESGNRTYIMTARRMISGLL
jgi:hypothetical protein